MKLALIVALGALWVAAPAHAGLFVPAPGSPFPVAYTTYALTAGHFNRDANEDLAIIDSEDDLVFVYLGDGAGAFSEAPGSPISLDADPHRPVAVQGVGSGDFNEDGLDDLVLGEAAQGREQILLATGGGRFEEADGSPYLSSSPMASPSVADFNHDGHLDIAQANYYDATVTVLLGRGDGTFSPSPQSPVATGAGAIDSAVADFNRDGNPDLVTSDAYADTATVLLGNGQGGFAQDPSGALPTGETPHGISTGDFNGDGFADFATADYDIDADPDVAGVTVQLGDGHGGFPRSISYPGLNEGWSHTNAVAFGDFEQIGNTQLAFGSEGGTSSDVLAIQSGGPTGATPAPGSPFEVYENPYALVVADFNNDGLLDLAMSTDRRMATVLLSTGERPQAPPATGPGTNDPGAPDPASGTPAVPPAKQRTSEGRTPSHRLRAHCGEVHPAARGRVRTTCVARVHLSGRYLVRITNGRRTVARMHVRSRRGVLALRFAVTVPPRGRDYQVRFAPRPQPLRHWKVRLP